MAAFLRSLLRRSIFRGEANLQSLRDPYAVLSGIVEPDRVRVVLDAGASDGRISRRLLKLFRSQVRLTFGEAVAPESVTASGLEQRVCTLGGWQAPEM